MVARCASLWLILAACGYAEKPVLAVSTVGAAPYFSSAWPDDRRLDDGYLRTDGLRLEGLARTSLIDNGDRVVRGFGLSSPIYVPFTGNPGFAEQTPEQSLTADAQVFLVALDQASRVPIEIRFVAEATSMLPANTLIARPVTGFPLRQGVTHALIVRSNETLGPDRAMYDGLHGNDAHYQRLREWLKRERIDDVAIGVVFTTQEVVAPLRELMHFVEAQPDPQPAVMESQDAVTYTIRQGTYVAPYLLQGAKPYVTEGGRIDTANAAAETMRFTLCTPKTEPPSGGYPVVMYSHGTGGSYQSVLYQLCGQLSGLGIAAVGIDQVLHGPRGGNGACFGGSSELCFFNPLNPISVRSLPAQSALDHVSLRKALKAVPGVALDLAKLGFFGHSQGGLTGALYAAIDPMVRGFALSGAGGHLTTTVLVRKDPLDFEALAKSALFLNLPPGETFDAFHPGLALVQTLAEAADPLNYAPYWQSETQPMYVTSGGMDSYTPHAGAEAMAAAGGIPQLLPNIVPSPAFQLRALLAVSLPKIGSGFQYFPEGNHYVAQSDAAQAQWRTFFQSLFSSGEATIPPLQ